MGIILIFFSIHSLTKIAPGSEMLGVPASEINEITFPLYTSTGEYALHDTAIVQS